MSTYVLPELAYDYSALEPHISAKVMELHHDKHHAAYVNGANSALERLAEARAEGDTSLVSKLTRDLTFNLAGHVNHSVFWRNLSPDGGGRPAGRLVDAITRDFGSFESFQGQFGATAMAIQGSGWAMLAFDPISGSLMTLQLHDHQGDISAGAVPLLMLDMWEHAYYLDYHNAKADYVNAFWNVVDWDDVSERLARAEEDVVGISADTRAVR